jgi:hypothetical protein
LFPTRPACARISCNAGERLDRWISSAQSTIPPRECAGTYPWTIRLFTICYMMKMYAVQRGWMDTAGWQLVSWTTGGLTGGPAPKQPRHSITSVLRPGRLDRYALQPVSEWVSWPQHAQCAADITLQRPGHWLCVACAVITGSVVAGQVVWNGEETTMLQHIALPQPVSPYVCASWTPWPRNTCGGILAQPGQRKISGCLCNNSVSSNRLAV